MACASSCQTQDHSTYADCLRDKGLHVAAVNSTHNGYTTGGGHE